MLLFLNMNTLKTFSRRKVRSCLSYMSYSKKNAQAVIGFLINFDFKLYCVDDLQSAVGQSIYGEVQNVFCDFLPWHRDYLPVLILNKANVAYSVKKNWMKN